MSRNQGGSSDSDDPGFDVFGRWQPNPTTVRTANAPASTTSGHDNQPYPEWNRTEEPEAEVGFIEHPFFLVGALHDKE
jgi:hypothetical protein